MKQFNDRAEGKRPDGLTIFPGKFGKPLVWDVTVAQSYIAITSQQPGGAADAAERRKEHKYQGLSDKFIVQPVGFETLGAGEPGRKHSLTKFGAG